MTTDGRTATLAIMEELSEDVELVLRVYVVVRGWQEGRWWYGEGVRRRALVVHNSLLGTVLRV